MKYRIINNAAAIALLAVGLPARGEISLSPPSPTVNETVRVQFVPNLSNCDIAPTRLIETSMANDRITVAVSVRTGFACGVSPPTPPIEVALGQFPAGSYEVEVLTRWEAGGTISRETKSFVVTARQPQDPLANYTDLWWNSQQSGWGLNIVHHPSNVIFATWFAYDDDGRPAWYVVPTGQWSAADQGRNSANHFYDGPIYRTSGPTGGVIDPSRVTRTLVGSANFAFVSWGRLDVRLTISGVTTTKTLVRQSF